MDKTEKKQNESKLHENPVLVVKDIEARQGKLDREMLYLLNKAKYYVPKPKVNETGTIPSLVTAWHVIVTSYLLALVGNVIGNFMFDRLVHSVGYWIGCKRISSFRKKLWCIAARRVGRENVVFSNEFIKVKLRS